MRVSTEFSLLFDPSGALVGAVNVEPGQVWSTLRRAAAAFSAQSTRTRPPARERASSCDPNPSTEAGTPPATAYPKAPTSAIALSHHLRSAFDVT